MIAEEHWDARTGIGSLRRPAGGAYQEARPHLEFVRQSSKSLYPVGTIDDPPLRDT